MFRLKELRLENGIKRSKMSADLGINAGTLANYENELRQAPYDYLVMFADYFDVSIDYLLGREGGGGVPLSGGALNSHEKTLISDYRQCSSTGKRRIEEYAGMCKDCLWK